MHSWGVCSRWVKPWITNNFLTCSISLRSIKSYLSTGFHTWWYLGWLLLRIKLVNFCQNPAFYKICQKWQHPHIKLCKNQVLALELTYINVNTKGIQQYWWKLHAYLNRYVHSMVSLIWVAKLEGKSLVEKISLACNLLAINSRIHFVYSIFTFYSIFPTKIKISTQYWIMWLKNLTKAR